MALWDRREDIQDEIDAARKAIDRATKRGHATAEAEAKLQKVTSSARPTN